MFLNTKHAIHAATIAVAGLGANTAYAQDYDASYTFYGTPGLIEMPSGESANDGDIAITSSYFGNHQRNTFTFQLTPRLSGSFRYAQIQDFFLDGKETFDRSFDIHYQLVREGDYTPAVAIGLRDFLGTGVYSSEYVAATKNLGRGVKVTAGLGWGNLATQGGFDNPLGVLDDRFETRPALDFGEGGTPTFDQWFRGDAAVFGGIEWRASDRLSFKAEYSTDGYEEPVGRGNYDPESPYNFSVTYRPRPGFHLGLAYMYGTDIGLTGTFVLNPKDRPTIGGIDPAPLPIRVRAADVDAAASWQAASTNEAGLRQTVATAMAADGMTLISMELSQTRVRVRFSNQRYRATAQALGHVSRILTNVMPASVETFILEPVEAGLPVSATTLRRGDLELYENAPDGAALILASAEFDSAGPNAGLIDAEPTSPNFTWGVSPYFRFSTFDPDRPFIGDLGAEISATYRFAPNLVLSGAVRKKVIGNLDESQVVDGPTPNGPHPVRSLAALYNQNSDPSIEYLTLAYYFNPGRDVYGRVTVGYLERMFGGVSTELLWKPVDSRLAFGAELNYVAQRDYDMKFGFQDYDVLMGHLSGYYDFGNGFHGQIDVGRYLAGDYGATFSLDREFENGWKVGAFFTLTDVTAEEFGEGSFDKGIRLTIPVDWFFGTPTRRESENTLRSLSRDGGAQLNVDGRLYGIVRDAHRPDLEKRWGRFWR